MRRNHAEAVGRVVLLVQPEHDDREMYVECLNQHGFVTVPVSTATDALRLASKADVVVTGILLPDHMDGIELVRRLKSAESTKHVPVLVLTACVWQSDRDRATASGCDLFLAKPCLPDVLVREIHRVLTLHLLPTPQMATASRLVVRNVS